MNIQRFSLSKDPMNKQEKELCCYQMLNVGSCNCRRGSNSIPIQNFKAALIINNNNNLKPLLLFIRYI